MARLTMSQFARWLGARTTSVPFQVAPAISTAPVVQAVIVGNAVTYTPASGVTGTPTPTLTHDLYVNGTKTATSYVSGSYAATTAGDSIAVLAIATNGVGSPATLPSATITVGAAPSVGAPAFTAQSAPAATVSRVYRYPFFATNTPSAFALDSGTLPTGLVLNTTTGVVSGTPTATGTFVFVVSAVNASGTTLSSTQSVVVTYLAALNPQPVVGVPTRFSVPGFTGSVVSQQWYLNTGTGPVLKAGATGTSLTHVSGDAGAFPSVRLVLDTGETCSSFEFPALASVLSQSGVLQSATDPGVNTPGMIGGSERAGNSLNIGARVRAVWGSKYYVESVAGPGSYSGTMLGDLSSVPGYLPNGGFFTGMAQIQNLGSAAIILGPTDTTPATATRPVTSTGIGFFVKNGRLYDANGNKFLPRGINRCHWDANAPGTASVGLFNAKASVHRMFMDQTNPGAGGLTNTALMNEMVSTAHKVVAIPCFAGTKVIFTGSISGNVLTVNSITAGNISPSGSGTMSGTGVPTSPKVTITSQLTNTNGSGIPGKEGTYATSGTGLTLGTTTFTYSYATSGDTSPTTILSIAHMLVDQFSIWNPFERQSIINLANEWGHPATSFTGSISGNTLTVTTAPNFTLYSKMMVQGTGVTPFTVLNPISATNGGTGTYNIDVAQTVASTSTLIDVTWREANIAAIAILRAGGYRGTIMIDAPGSGQDGGAKGLAWTILNHGPAVFNADPQKNIILSLHIYGGHKAGQFANTANLLYQASASTGVPYCIGEFGPAYVVGGPGSYTSVEALEVMADCEAYGLGWLAWAWDDRQNETADNGFYALCKNAGGSFGVGYNTSDPAQLTTFGRQVVLDPTYGLANIAVPATVFP